MFVAVDPPSEEPASTSRCLTSSARRGMCAGTAASASSRAAASCIDRIGKRHAPTRRSSFVSVSILADLRARHGESGRPHRRADRARAVDRGVTLAGGKGVVQYEYGIQGTNWNQTRTLAAVVFFSRFLWLGKRLCTAVSRTKPCVETVMHKWSYWRLPEGRETADGCCWGNRHTSRVCTAVSR